jgi:KDO2-lipid IV(A) lauroyltransferase
VKKKPYRFILYLMARFSAAVLYILPRAMLLSSARFLGRIAYHLCVKDRKRALCNLKLAFGNTKTESEIQSIAHKVFENLAQTTLEVVQFPKLNSEKVEAFVEIGDAYEVYRQLLSEGKGLIALTSHIGNWELLGGIFTLKGFKGKAIVKNIYYEPYHRWIEKLRLSIKIQTIGRDQSSKAILTWLAQGGLIGILPDQDISELKGVFVDFFGTPAYTPVSPVKLSLASGAPILPIFLIRQPNDRYKIVLGKVIRPVIKTTRQEAILEYTRQWMGSCESIIRQHPEQWGWMHNRWKTKKDEIEKIELPL